eukprot:m.12999 g.12999  ORF g.12999 m.12999 type:complete len:386 (+) comp4769_c0_seq1:323-1480(+)
MAATSPVPGFLSGKTPIPRVDNSRPPSQPNKYSKAPVTNVKFTPKHVPSKPMSTKGPVAPPKNSSSTTKATLRESPSPHALLDSLFEERYTGKESSSATGTPWRSRSLPKSFFSPPIPTRCPIISEGGPALSKGNNRAESPNKFKRQIKRPNKRSKSASDYRPGTFKPIKEESEMLKFDSQRSRSVTPRTPQCGKRASPAGSLLPVKPKKRTRPVSNSEKSHISVIAPPSLDRKMLAMDDMDDQLLSEEKDIFSKLSEFDSHMDLGDKDFGGDFEPISTFKWRETQPVSPCSTPVEFGVTPFDEVSEELDAIESHPTFSKEIHFEPMKRPYSCPELSADLNAFRMYTPAVLDDVLPGDIGSMDDDVFGSDPVVSKFELDSKTFLS